MPKLDKKGVWQMVKSVLLFGLMPDYVCSVKDYPDKNMYLNTPEL